MRIDKTPPPPPTWTLELAHEEACILLAALDFARRALDQMKGMGTLGQDYPHDSNWYQARIDPIEQALARELK